MTDTNLQVVLFQHLKATLPPHLSIVDEIADLLNISIDSAYRRIRGEKPIELEEIRKLCTHFHLSMDKLLHLQSDSFIFSGNLNTQAESRFEDWLKNAGHQLELLCRYEKKHLYFLIKDIPPFLHFQIPELAAFKYFFWMKSILHYDELKGVKFSVDDSRYDKFHVLSKRVIELYNSLPTTEIWNIESISSSLRQVQFYHEAGAFSSTADVRLLYGKIEELINHIEKEAEAGVKFAIGQQPKSNSPEYRLFVNELILGDNTILADIGGTRLTFLNHSVLYFVSTSDERFNNAMFNNLENLMKKSTLISTIGEKERNQFFNSMRKEIHERLALIR